MLLHPYNPHSINIPALPSPGLATPSFPLGPYLEIHLVVVGYVAYCAWAARITIQCLKKEISLYPRGKLDHNGCNTASVRDPAAMCVFILQCVVLIFLHRWCACLMI